MEELQTVIILLSIIVGLLSVVILALLGVVIALLVKLRQIMAKIDRLFEIAKGRGVYTIGIGDGGNELGMASVRDVIRPARSPRGASINHRRVRGALVTRFAGGRVGPAH